MGTLAETITVSGQAPMIQATSGERSYAIAADTVQNIPINGRSINGLSALAPGVVAGSVNGTRTNQNNFQIDGVGAMDTGNNGTMITVNQEVIAEVKVLTSNYQAEYGRSAGAQISAVTKSGGTEFHGSVYTDRRNDDLNANSWINRRGETESQSEGLRLHRGRANGKAQERFKDFLLRCSGISAAHERRRNQPGARANGARASGRFFADPRQQWEPVQPYSGWFDWLAVHRG